MPDLAFFRLIRGSPALDLAAPRRQGSGVRSCAPKKRGGRMGRPSQKEPFRNMKTANMTTTNAGRRIAAVSPGAGGGRVMLVAATMTAAVPMPAFAQDSADEARLRQDRGRSARLAARRGGLSGRGRHAFSNLRIAPGTQAADSGQVMGGDPAGDHCGDRHSRAGSIRLKRSCRRSPHGLKNRPICCPRWKNAARCIGSRGQAPDTSPPIDRDAAANRTRNPCARAGCRASPERLAAVQAIAKPQTDDAGDDEYSYGFRLWNAGF